jgi:hypothetical protein
MTESTYTAIANTVLTQDVIASANVLVSQNDVNQAAVFVNPNAAGQSGNSLPELLAIVPPTGQQTNNTLNYAARSASSETGWSLAPVTYSSGGGTITIQGIDEIVAGTNRLGSSNPGIFAFYSDGAQLWAIQLQIGGWSAPVAIYLHPVVGLDVAYDGADNLIVYCRDSASGNLVIGTFNSNTSQYGTTNFELPNAPTGATCRLAVNGAQEWTLLMANTSAAMIYTGKVGNSAIDTTGTLAALASGVTATGAVLGYWAAVLSAPLFIVTGSDGNIYSIQPGNAQATAQTQLSTSNDMVACAAQITFDDNYNQVMNVYAVDNTGILWGLHSAPGDNGNLTSWTPWLPIGTGIAGAVADLNPVDSQSLFTIGDDGSVGLWVMDPNTYRWRSAPLLMPNTVLYEVTRYHLEFTVFDPNGAPAPNTAVTLAVGATSSSADISVGGVGYTVPSGDPTGISLSTDAFGKVTVAMLVTTSLAAPEFVLNYQGAPLASLQPNSALQTYLSGNGQLNLTNPNGALPVFDSAGATLQAAQVNNQALAPAIQGQSQAALQLAGTAAQAIASTVVYQPPAQSAPAPGATRNGPSGFAFNLHKDKPSFIILHTQAELEAHKQRHADLGGIFSDLDSVAGDVFSGIEAGVITVEHAVVDIANGILSITATIGNAINQAISVTITTVEDVAKAVAGVFQAIGAAIEDAIDWLKALFNFQDIWSTKMVLEAGILGAISTISGVLQAAGPAVNAWFAGEEAKINAAFKNLESYFSANQSFSSSAPNAYFQPGTQSNGSLGGNGSASDFSTNPQSNWLQNKMSAGSPPPLPDPGNQQGIETAGNSLNSSYTTSSNLAAYSNSLGIFTGNLQSTFPQASSFGSVAITDLLGLFQDLVDAVMALLNDLVDASIDVMQAAVQGLQDVLSTPIDCPPLQALWNWVAEAGGQSGGDTLTLASAISLLLAFPVTIAWKLVNGASETPFPTNQPAPWPVPNWPTQAMEEKRAGAYRLGDTSSTCATVAQYVNLVIAIPKCAAEFSGSDTPSWVRKINLIGALAVVALTTGLPAEDELIADIEANPAEYVPLAGSIFDIGILAALIASTFTFSQSRTLLGIGGIVSTVLGVAYVIDNSPPQPDALVRISQPLPNVFNLTMLTWPAGAPTPFQCIMFGLSCMIYIFAPLVALTANDTATEQ